MVVGKGVEDGEERGGGVGGENGGGVGGVYGDQRREKEFLSLLSVGGCRKQRRRRRRENEREREREGVFISSEVMIGGLTFGCQKETNVSHSNAAHKGKLAFRPK